jgi:CheY-like chemotaxis protein
MARVLCIDDDNVTLTLLKGVLENDGHYVLTAGNGKDGIRKSRVARADVIICDLMMPEMDGYEFCDELKKLAITKNTPVILLTSRSTPLSIKNAADLGATYLAKPFNHAELQVLVAKLGDS